MKILQSFISARLSKKVIYILTLTYLVSCSTVTTRTLHSENDVTAMDTDELLNSFCVNDLSRTPASDSLCKEYYSPTMGTVKKSDTNYSKRLQRDPLQKAEAGALVPDQEISPVVLSPAMSRFRGKYLGFLKINKAREPLTKSFEASFRIRSEILAKTMSRNQNYGQYDIVIVGAGVHGIIALHQVLKQNPNLKVLLLDEGDTAGATFRYGKDVFSINSSNRASGEDTRPLPGEGNINELPGLPIQVSDLTAVKYPSANDLGTALVAGLYAAIREYPNVETLFDTKARTLGDKPSDSAMTESLSIRKGSYAQDFRIDAQKVIVTTGLGEPLLPPKIVESLKTTPALKESVNGKPPRVLTFEDMIRLIAESNDPLSFFKDKKIGIVGKGDSANVFIEFLLGYAPQTGYGRSSAQTGKPGKIYWIGQDKKSCNEFISDARSRYNSVSTGFKSSSANIDALITPNQNKLVDVAERGVNKVDVILDGGEKIDGLDYVVVATGFKQNVRALFSKLREENKFDTDLELFNSEFNLLEGRTSVSPSLTKVGRQLKDHEVYVLGTAANLFTEESVNKAPVGIVQNFVGIFVNAPRVVSSVRLLTREISPKAKEAKLQKERIAFTPERQAFKITNVQETRYISDQTLPYLETTFKEALSVCQAVSNEKIVLNISLAKDGTIEIDSGTKADVKVLVDLMAESRDFFSQTKELLKLLPNQELLLTASSVNGVYDLAKVQAQVVKLNKSKTVTLDRKLIVNRSIKLRGLGDDSIRRESKESSLKKIKIFNSRELDLLDPKTYTDQQISVDISAGTFFTGKQGNIEITVSKPYKLMATSFTQKFYEKFVKHVSPGILSYSTDVRTPLQIKSRFPGENRPLESVSALNAEWIVDELRSLSRSDLETDQQFMTELFPDHKKGRIYDLPTIAQLDRAYKLAKTEDGDTLDAMFARGDLEKLGKYVHFLSEGGTVSVVEKLPLYIDGSPIYLQGNVRELTKDEVYRGNFLGEDKRIVPHFGSNSNFGRVALGGSYSNTPDYVQSWRASNTYLDTKATAANIGFRIVATDP